MIPFKDDLLRLFPDLESDLVQAGIKEDMGNYLKKSLVVVIFASLLFSIISFFVLLKEGASLFFLVPIFLLFFMFFFFVILQFPKMMIRKRKREIESDLIYTVRHFLLRMECGSSLINALEETAGLDTISAKYFGEVVHDINIGASTEEAIDYAVMFTPSERFKEVMNIIRNSLRTGTDLKKSIKTNLEEMTHDKVLEIKDYGKRLNPLSMFYMILGIIVPSIGVSVFVIGSTFFPAFLGERAASAILVFFGILLVIIQSGFYIVFRSMRPLVSS